MAALTWPGMKQSGSTFGMWRTGRSPSTCRSCGKPGPRSSGGTAPTRSLTALYVLIDDHVRFPLAGIVGPPRRLSDAELVRLAFCGLAGPDLHAPADPVQQHIHPGQGVVHAEPAADDLGDPGQCPALILVPALRGRPASSTVSG